MDNYKGAIQECRFNYRGYPCVIVMQCGAFRTGYVGLPKHHKYYHTHYNDIPINCHGGLTYSSEYLVDQDDVDRWWIGFDTAHYLDGHDFDAAIELFADYPDTLIQIANLRRIYAGETFRAASQGYMAKELMCIVDQLEDIVNYD